MNTLDNLVEVTLKNSEDFLKVKETLTRIGVASNKTNTLYQSCHILHKQGRYYIVHFKEMFLLDGKDSNFDDSDVSRRDSIISLLDQWNLVEIVSPDFNRQNDLKGIKVISFKDKDDWTLVPKYNIGNS